MEVAVFGLFAFLAAGSALIVVTHRNPIYATMSLVVTLVSIAALFVLLGAPFLAALQILIYTGAIVVLFLFVIMLLNIRADVVEKDAPRDGGQRWAAIAAAALFGGLILSLFWRAYAFAAPAPLTLEQVALRTLARELFTRYMLPFQLIGLLLLAAVIAATVLARRAETPPPGSAS